MISLARRIARARKDDRTHFHGAVCVRKDGAIVASANGKPAYPDRKHHAEYRALRKAGKHAELYVVRVDASGRLVDSTPCVACQKAIRSASVKTVYFSDRYGEIQVWKPKQDIEYACKYHKPVNPTVESTTLVLKKLYPASFAPPDKPAIVFGLDREPFCGPPEPTYAYLYMIYPHTIVRDMLWCDQAEGHHRLPRSPNGFKWLNDVKFSGFGATQMSEKYMNWCKDVPQAPVG